MSDRDLIAQLIASEVAVRGELARVRVENEKLREFIGQLCERVYLAHETFGRLAERREKR